MARGRRPPIAFATGSQTCMVAGAVSKPQAQRFKVIGNQWSNTLRGRSEDKLARESHQRGTIRPRTDSVWYESDPAIWHPAVPHQV
jgi:hypothetical protein